MVTGLNTNNRQESNDRIEIRHIAADMYFNAKISYDLAKFILDNA